MTGLIWVIQIVHYPSFHFIQRQDYRTFAAFHTRSITFIVMPIMAIEFLSQALLLFKAPNGVHITSSALLLLIWAATIFYSIPCHNILATGHDTETVNMLVKTNWVRTVAWTLKSLILLYGLHQHVIDKL
jgi:hypothetical protein